MKIALFHNYYKQPGGEDTMFELEIAALREHGHTVIPYTVHNSHTLTKNSLSQKIRTALNAPHSYSSEIAIAKFLAQHRPDISHVHNWFPNLSPSIFTAHHDAGIPIVQTLHNYRLACAGGNYQRNGESCQACRPGYNLPAIRHRCYKNSTAGSIAWKRIWIAAGKTAPFAIWSATTLAQVAKCDADTSKWAFQRTKSLISPTPAPTHKAPRRLATNTSIDNSKTYAWSVASCQKKAHTF